MHNTGYKSALARRVCRYSDARPPRKTDGVLLESEIPPHMRGKVVAHGCLLLDVGITPAYAGKSGLHPQAREAGQDHPRICGEKLIFVMSTPLPYGSPPHMRGKANDYLRMAPDDRITPAYAGKSCPCPWFRRRYRDHPRICGEKYQSLVALLHVLGSPPHMRGKD